jgi:hypothetical protein
MMRAWMLLSGSSFLPLTLMMELKLAIIRLHCSRTNDMNQLPSTHNHFAPNHATYAHADLVCFFLAPEDDLVAP